MIEIDKYPYNGFLYIYDPNCECSIIEHNKSKPKNLFKFYPMNKNSVDALTKGFLYASHPIELNDILDSSSFLLYTSKKLGWGKYENLLLSKYKNIEDLMEFYKEDSNREDLCRGFITEFWEKTTNLFGIISMTVEEKNALMWPHYTQEKGFQLKFNTEELEKSIKNENKFKNNEEYLGLYPVNYTKKLDPIDIHNFKEYHIPFSYATNIKLKKWEYEKEWRFLISKPNMGVPFSKSGLNVHEDYIIQKENRYVRYNSELIEEITVGFNFFNACHFEIKWIDAKTIRVKPKRSNTKILNYITKKLSDKFYHSGIKNEIDKDGSKFLIRTKEKMEIKKEIDGSFILTRTDEIIKFN